MKKAPSIAYLGVGFVVVWADLVGVLLQLTARDAGIDRSWREKAAIQ